MSSGFERTTLHIQFPVRCIHRSNALYRFRREALIRILPGTDLSINQPRAEYDPTGIMLY